MLQHPDVVFYKFQIKVFSATEDLSVANKVSLFDEKGGTNGFALLRTYNIKCGIDCSGKAVLADENIKPSPLALSFRVYPFQDLSVAQDKPARVLILGTPFKTRRRKEALKNDNLLKFTDKISNQTNWYQNPNINFLPVYQVGKSYNKGLVTLFEGLTPVAGSALKAENIALKK